MGTYRRAFRSLCLFTMVASTGRLSAQALSLEVHETTDTGHPAGPYVYSSLGTPCKCLQVQSKTAIGLLLISQGSNILYSASLPICERWLCIGCRRPSATIRGHGCRILSGKRHSYAKAGLLHAVVFSRR